VRYTPGAAAAFAVALGAALTGSEEEVDGLARAAGAEPDAVRGLATLLLAHPRAAAPSSAQGSQPDPEVVVLWGERITTGANAKTGARALLRIADALGMAAVAGAGLLEAPAAANGRGLREAGVLPNAGPGLMEAPTGTAGHDSHAIAEALASGELSALYLHQCDPLRDLPDRGLWERALAAAGTVVAHAAFLTEGISEHADVVFPAEAYPEKEGTVVHPDGRLQRLRPAIARPGSVWAGWQVIAELALGLDVDLDVLSAAMASRQLFEAVPFYAGLTLEEIGGRGVRWQERTASGAFPRPGIDPTQGGGEVELSPPSAEDLDFGAFRSVWDAPEVEFSPALAFLSPRAEPAPPLSYAGEERT
jgi:NADH-quinone oxidoreductase subunit G